MKRLIAISTLASQVAACGTATTFQLRSGYEIEGTPVRRSDNRIKIRTDEGVTFVHICEIADVSHPGKSMAITGTALLGGGALMGGLATAGWVSLKSRQNATDGGDGGMDIVAGSLLAVFTLYSAALLLTGAGLAGTGYPRWSESEEMTGNFPAAACVDDEDEGYRPYEPPMLRREPEVRPGVTPLP